MCPLQSAMYQKFQHLTAHYSQPVVDIEFLSLCTNDLYFAHCGSVARSRTFTVQETLKSAGRKGRETRSDNYGKKFSALELYQQSINRDHCITTATAKLRGSKLPWRHHRCLWSTKCTSFHSAPPCYRLCPAYKSAEGLSW